mgnify:CR=1 FL=1
MITNDIKYVKSKNLGEGPVSSRASINLVKRGVESAQGYPAPFVAEILRLHKFIWLESPCGSGCAITESVLQKVRGLRSCKKIFFGFAL